MNINGYYGDDAWDYGHKRRPSPHHGYSDYPNGFLAPGMGGGLHRSRSQGHGPAPTINVYNRNFQDQEGSPMPPYVPYPASPPSHRASSRSSSHSRGRSRFGERLGDEILEREIADMVLENRLRSRSRGRSDASAFDRPPSGLAQWQLAQREAELRELSRERQRKLDEDRIKAQARLDALDNERKMRDAQDKKEADEKRWRDEYERKQREAKDKAKADEQALKDRLEREAKEKEGRDAAAYKAFKQKEQDEKDAKERKYNEFLREQKEREEKKKREEKEAEEKFQTEMRRRLQSLGYTEATIDMMVDEEKAKKFKKTVQTTDTLDVWRPPRAPIYPKIRREFIEIDTLKYYDLPWKYDSSDPDYIIIMRDMDKRETDYLFEHTSRLRSGKLLIEPAKKQDKQFALYRRRSKSRSGRPVEVGILRRG
ncbi:hypothetical protein M409DRAFT_49704 [Zasmidium cellare ATCC 36951]|uniref:Uncharacterized protein n=1 Tax=Zasmidium cellare ATCC 36951 TaxID=1080233 RepID=A0A6A6D515_ZASCE|nr:uncharacterized protein M409DRAFT_49704 [Zasmidium cellare ATCC 36951]KAF2173229.1 hypothetical protein M409DRAFT_49704 [Zasmidium cellare ATCC 36951]